MMSAYEITERRRRLLLLKVITCICIFFVRSRWISLTWTWRAELSGIRNKDIAAE